MDLHSHIISEFTIKEQLQSTLPKSNSHKSNNKSPKSKVFSSPLILIPS